MKKFLFFILFPFLCFGLKKEPWIGNIYEFELLSEYSLATYKKVADAKPQLKKRSYDHTLDFDLDLAFSGSSSFDWDIYFQKTPRRTFNFQSTALQYRHQFLSDCQGDALSLLAAASVRYTTPTSLRDIGCFSHSDADMELLLAFGKEFDQDNIWRGRLWAYALAGQANHGRPWVRGRIALDLNEEDRWIGSIWIDGGKGFGKNHTINIDHFDGYGNVDYTFLDVILRYGIRLAEWGTFHLEYSYRIKAESCPSKVHFFLISYTLPFSF